MSKQPLPCVVIIGILILVTTQPACAKRPNIVLIMADDIGYECFGCYGSRQYRTPRIDRLAQRGMRFTHCYSQPLCTPSRVKLMTGLSNARNYSSFSVLNSDQRTMGHLFRDAGYDTLIAGKWQLLGAEHYPQSIRLKGSWPRAAGFDRVCLWQVDRLGSRFWKPLLYIDGENRQFQSKSRYGPDVVTEYIERFLDEPRTRPFFIYYPMILVHSPFVPTPDSDSRDSKHKQKNFEDMVAYMDKLVGRIADKLQQRGAEKNTLILFCGDNGTHPKITSRLGDVEIAGGKGQTTDAGTRVPLIAYWPGTVPESRVCDDLVDFSDFLPTCLDAAGQPLPQGLDGQTFWPQLHGEPGEPRAWIYCFSCPRPERMQPKRFVRDKRWKLYGDGRFFDIADDPLEQRMLNARELNATTRAVHNKLQNALASMPAQGQSLLKFVPQKK
jgi:arylsulfatase A